MKSFNNKEWEKLATGKSEFKPENEILTTKALREKRGEKRRLITLKELIKKGTIMIYF